MSSVKSFISSISEKHAIELPLGVIQCESLRFPPTQALPAATLATRRPEPDTGNPCSGCPPGVYVFAMLMAFLVRNGGLSAAASTMLFPYFSLLL